MVYVFVNGQMCPAKRSRDNAAIVFYYEYSRVTFNNVNRRTVLTSYYVRVCGSKSQMAYDGLNTSERTRSGSPERRLCKTLSDRETAECERGRFRADRTLETRNRVPCAACAHFFFIPTSCPCPVRFDGSPEDERSARPQRRDVYLYGRDSFYIKSSHRGDG